MTKEKSKELVTQEKKDVLDVSAANDLDAWGSSEMSADDLVIPTVNVMQSTSDLVVDGKVKFGDFVLNTDNSIVSDSNGFEAVPFYMKKIWIIQKFNRESNKFEYHSCEDVTRSNEKQDWEFEDETGLYKRVLTRKFYMYNEKISSIPFTVLFKSTSAKAGKILATQMYTNNRASNLPPAGKLVQIYAEKETKNNNKYNVLRVRVLGNTPSNLLSKAFDWYKTIIGNEVKESGIEENF